MNPVIIRSHEEFERFLGKKIGESEYHAITQEQINLFADATLDHQWIHTDPERAKKEGAFGATIAHGYLTLSLLPKMWEEIANVQNFEMLVNYGVDNLKFGAPVIVNSRIRTHVWLEDIKNLRGISRVQLKIQIEIEDNKKPAIDAMVTFLYHFNK